MYNNLGIFSQMFVRVKRPTFRARALATTQVSGYDNDLFFGATIIDNGTGPTGPTGPTGSIGSFGPTGPAGQSSSLIWPVTIVTTSPYDAQPNDYFIGVDRSLPSIVNLPAGPIGTVYIVKDVAGLAGPPTSATITVANITPIDGAASAVINTDYGSLTFVFNGTEWSIV